jgi:hypothetical protein
MVGWRDDIFQLEIEALNPVRVRGIGAGTKKMTYHSFSYHGRSFEFWTEVDPQD